MEALTLILLVDLVFLVHLFEGLETVVHQFDRHIYVGLSNFISEVELGHGLRDSDDSEQGTRSNVHVAYFFLAFSLELSLLDVSCHDILMQLVRNNRFEGLGLGNERPHGLRINLVFGICNWSMQLLMY